MPQPDPARNVRGNNIPFPSPNSTQFYNPPPSLLSHYLSFSYPLIYALLSLLLFLCVPSHVLIILKCNYAISSHRVCGSGRGLFVR